MWEIIFEVVVELIPLPFLKRFRRRKEWKGVAEEIKEGGDFLPARRNVIVVFRKEDGALVRVKMKPQKSLNYAVGQRYKKHRAEALPRPI